MSDQHVVVTRAGAVTTVRLNRPAQLNAITPAMHHALQAAFDAFAADAGQRVAVLTGTGRAFCAGSDLKAARARQKAAETLALPRSGYGGLVQRFDCDKPLIAAVNGLAYGGGFELAMCCDVLIAADTARFGLSEPHVGQVAIGGAPARLVRAIGVQRAMAIALTGDAIPAADAAALGLVSEVVPPGQLDATVQAWVARILRGGPAAVEATKALIQNAARTASLAEAIGDQDALPSMCRWRASGERQEGAEAFVAKRRPSWSQP